MTTLESPVYSSGQAVLRTGVCVCGPCQRCREGPFLHSQKEPRFPVLGATAGVQPIRMSSQCALASSRGLSGQPFPTPSIVARTDPEQLLPHGQLGSEQAGRERCGRERPLCRGRTHPVSGQTPLRHTSLVLIAAFGASLSRKGRDIKLTPGAGEDSGAGAPTRVSARSPAAPLPSPCPGGVLGSPRVRRNLLWPGVPGWVQLGRGVP